MDDGAARPADDDAVEIPTVTRLAAVVVVGVMVALAAAIVWGIAVSTGDGGAGRAVLLAVVLWILTAVLALATVLVLREWLRHDDGGEAGRAHRGALRLVLVALVVVSGSVAGWVTFDRATNLSDTEVGVLLDEWSDSFGEQDAPPDATALRASLTAEIEDTEVDTATFGYDEQPPGLRVLEVVRSTEDVPAQYQVTDDDGGSPHCLQFLSFTADDGTTEVVGAFPTEGLC